MKDDKNFYELYLNIANWFDFEKVKKTMDALDWEWAIDGFYEIPSIQTIRDHALERCRNAYYGESGYSSCGGFEAQYNKEDNILSLRFIVSEWDSELDK